MLGSDIQACDSSKGLAVVISAKFHLHFFFHYTTIWNVSSCRINFFCSHFTWWLSPHHSLFLWQHCSLTLSPTALLKMCTASHPLPPHTHPVLTIHPTMPLQYSLCMLFEYAQEAELYFTSNTTMVFLPGDHVLDRNVTVANVTRLTMHEDTVVGPLVTLLCFCDLYYMWN